MQTHNSVNWCIRVFVLSLFILSIGFFTKPLFAQVVQIMTTDNIEAMARASVEDYEQWTYIHFDFVNQSEIRFGHASQPDQQITYKPFNANGPFFGNTETSTYYTQYENFTRGAQEPIRFDIKPETSDHMFRATYNADICPIGPYFSITEGGYTPDHPYWTGLINSSDDMWYYREALHDTEWKQLAAHTGTGIEFSVLSGRIEIATSNNPLTLCATLEWNLDPVKFSFPETTKALGKWIAVPVLIDNGLGLEGIQGSFTMGDFLTYNSFSLQDGVASNWLGSFTVDPENDRKVNFQLAALDGQGITNSGELLVWLFFDTNGLYGNTSTVKFETESISTVPVRFVETQNGSIIHGTTYMTGNVHDFDGSLIPGTNTLLQGAGWGMQGPIADNGSFELPLEPAGNFILNFQQMGETSSRQITIGTIQDMMDCSTGKFTCDPIAANTFPENGPGNIQDTICVVHYWLEIERSDCEVGVWIYNNPLPVFDNFTPGLLGVEVTGRYMGYIYPTSAKIAALTVSTPTISFGEEVNLTDGSKAITLQVQGNGRRALGFELTGAEMVGKGNMTANGNRVIILSDEGFENETFYLRLTTKHVIVDFHFDENIERYDAETTGPGPDPIYLNHVLLPFVEKEILDLGEEEMPILEPDQD